MPARTIDGENGLDPAVAFGDVGEDARIHLLIRFDAPLTLEQHEALEVHGILLLEYLENCAYIASLSRANWLCFTSREGDIGRLLGPLVASDKISPDILGGELQAWAFDDVPNHLEVLIGFHQDIEPSQAEALLSNEVMAPGIARDAKSPPEKHGPRSWAAAVEIGPEHDMSNIEALANDDRVRWIGQGPVPFIPSNNTARPIVNTETVQNVDSSGSTPKYVLAGQGVRIGICDFGIDRNHPGLKAITVGGGSGSSRVYDDLTASIDDGHGTFVASIAAGNGAGSEGFVLRGHAPNAAIGDYPQCGSIGWVYLQAIVDHGTRVTNHSYELAASGKYELQESVVDAIIRGSVEVDGVKVPARPQVWAAGNHGASEGYFSTRASAKNMIVVGSTDTVDGRLSYFSGLGPTADGRIKPDLVAPGCRESNPSAGNTGIQAAKAGTQGYAAARCGTSMAAPVVTGIVALMMEELRNTSWEIPHGVLRPLQLRPATFKAILVNTAVDQVKYEPYGSRETVNPDTGASVVFGKGPDFATGFGLVDALAASALIKNRNGWIQSSIGEPGERDHWCLEVPPKSPEVKVTLAWDDAPGNLASQASPKLTNDIDLFLVSPGGEVVRPWTLLPPGQHSDGTIAPGQIGPASRRVDRLNNVEMASVEVPKPGIWHVVVDGYFLKFGRSQPYSLAASAEFLGLCPDPPEDLCDRLPELCPPRQVCRKYPGICQIAVSRGLKRDDGVWILGSGGLIPVSTISHTLNLIQECEGAAWEPCPGWSIVIDGVPERTTAVVFDQDGRIHQETIATLDGSASGRISCSVDRVFPGQEFFLGFLDPDGRPLLAMVSPRIEMNRIGAAHEVDPVARKGEPDLK